MDTRKEVFPEVLVLDGIQSNPNNPNFSVLSHRKCNDQDATTSLFSNNRFLQTINNFNFITDTVTSDFSQRRFTQVETPSSNKRENLIFSQERTPNT